MVNLSFQRLNVLESSEVALLKKVKILRSKRQILDVLAQLLF